MHRRYTLTVLAVLALLLGTGHVLAQADGPPVGPSAPLVLAGTGFTYQGELTSGGTPVTDTCDFQFQLYDALSAGVQLGSPQTVTNVNIADGRFTVTLNGSGQFGASVFDGSARWLAIAVKCPLDGSYTNLTPRQALTPSPLAFALPGLRTEFSGLASPNVVGGHISNTVSGGAVGAVIAGGGADGNGNTVSAGYATVGGGIGNSASGAGATVGGGGWNGTTTNGNLAEGLASTIGGGYNNAIPVTGTYATVAGGILNLASGDRSAVGGGVNNAASGDRTTVGGGVGNVASGTRSTVGGGQLNTASAGRTTVGGGYSNTASGQGSTVGGGGWNGSITEGNVAGGAASTIGGGMGNETTAAGDYATVGGGRGNIAYSLYSTVGGGTNNTVSGQAATVGGGYTNQVFDDFGTIGGGFNSHVSGVYSTVGGGLHNTTLADYATVCGGDSNDATAGHATVCGGGDNEASAVYATIGGGELNTASGAYATVAGGQNNIASSQYATVAGGRDNTAGDLYATVAGGRGNVATGDYSFAAGRNARAQYNGSFVWSSNETTVIESTAADQFLVRATGGISLTTNVGGTTGCRLSAGGGTWNCTSDRNAKANFAPVDGVAILNTLAGLSIETWSFNTQDASIRHIGPMAQDWHAAFGLGEGDTTISAVDADGVALAAIQGLYSVVQEKDAALAQQSAEIAALQALNDALTAAQTETNARLTALEAGGTAAAPPAPVALPWLLLAGLGLLNLGGLGGYLLARRPRA